MAVNLYALRKRAVMVLNSGGRRDAVYFLQLVVEHVLSQDSQSMVDSALKHASKEWKGGRDLPHLVVQVGVNGIPRPGSPIYQWPFLQRAFCFDHELPHPLGYLGERDLWGYLFRTAEEQADLDALNAAQNIDKEAAKGYKDFRKGRVFESGQEFLKYRGQYWSTQTKERRARRDFCPPLPPRLLKILSLIKFIERKGNNASDADLHFLGCLKDKAVQLGYFS